MAKYILDPSGKIIEYTPSLSPGSPSTLERKSVENTKKRDFGLQEASANEGLVDGIDIVNKSVNSNYTNATNFSQNPLSFDGTDNNAIRDRELNLELSNSILGVEYDEFTANDIFLEVERNKSFGFKGEDQKGSLSYKPFTYIGDANQKDAASEFEILTGVNISGLEISDEVFRTTLMMFEYFAKIIARWAVIEAIVLLNKSRRILPGSANKIENHHLIIGRYDFTTFDIFSTYIFDVLNYPYKNSTLTERITAYFIGFTAWCAPNSVLNLDQIVRSGSDNEFKNFLDASLFSKDKHAFLFGTELPSMLLTIVSSSIELTLDSLLNSQHVKNRVKLLTRKFKQEAYWKNHVLYKSKLETLNFENRSAGQNSFDRFMSDLNYYYIKFYIERVQIGLKILKRYYNEETYQKKKQQSKNIIANWSAENFYPKGDKLTGKDFNTAMQSLGATPSANELDALKDAVYTTSNSKNTYTWQKSLTEGKSKESLHALPQLFKLGYNLMSNIAHFGGNLSLQDKTAQNFSSVKAKNADQVNDRLRLPKELVSEIEDYLESEYMPFYFHDIRTNEIISFHAFIESISDSFNPEYNAASGFGRIDDVRSYIKTTRNINLSFTVAAMNPDDHDLMWYQINKIVAMVYPQWSDGFPARPIDGSENSPFKYPFSQVPTASPLIRLRVGDVIKNNYSRSNLARLHGDPSAPGTKQFLQGLPNQRKNYEYYLRPGLYKLADRTAGLDLGIVNYNFETLSKTYNVDLETKIHKIVSEDSETCIVEIRNYWDKIKIEADNNKNNPAGIFGGNSENDYIQLAVDSKSIIKVRSLIVADDGKESYYNAGAVYRQLVDFDKSPIVSSYESGMSRGLAGFITQLDVNYNEVTWDVSRIGSKAPMMVKITINFAPIHDIPPGLDHNGALRAPVYNVGRINNQMFGDSSDFATDASGVKTGESRLGAGLERANTRHEIMKYLDESSN